MRFARRSSSPSVVKVCSYGAGVFLAMTSIALAATTWVGGMGSGGAINDWSVSSNWGGGFPSTGSTANFDHTSSNDSVIDATFGSTPLKAIVAVAGGGGYKKTLTVASGVTVLIVGAAGTGGFDISAFGAGGTLVNSGIIEFSNPAAGGPFTIPWVDTGAGAASPDWGEVHIDSGGGSACTVQLGSNIAVGKLVIASGSTLDLNGHTLTVDTELDVAGTIINSAGTGNIVLGSATVTSTGIVISPAHTVNLDLSGNTLTDTGGLSLTSANAKVIDSVGGGSISVSGATTFTTGGQIDVSAHAGATPTVTLSGTVSGTGTIKMGSNELDLGGATVGLGSVTLTTTGLTKFTGSGAQAVTLGAASNSYAAVTVASTSATTLTGSTFSTTGILTCTGGLTISTTATNSIGSTTSIAASTGSLTVTTSTSFSGLVTDSGTFTCSTASVALTFTGGLTVASGATAGFSNTSGTITFGGGSSLDTSGGGSVTITGGSSGTARISVTGAAAWSVPAGGTITASGIKLTNSTAALPGRTATNSVNVSGNTNWSFGGPNTLIWTDAAGGGNNNWSAGANWDLGVAPAAGDTVQFSGPGFAGVGGTSIDDIGGLSLTSMDMTGFTGTLTIKSSSTSLTTTGAVTVAGTLDINAQTLSVGTTLTIAAGAGTGMLKTSPGGTLTAGTTTVTSSGGTATLDITSCDSVTVGSLSASGTGTLAFKAGSAAGLGTAPLHATGATVDFSGFTSISWTPGGGVAGSLLLDGAAIGTRSFNPGSAAIPNLTTAPGTPFTDTILLKGDLSVVTSFAVTSGTFNMNFHMVAVTAGTAEVGSTATTSATLTVGARSLTVTGITYLNTASGAGSATLDLTGCSFATIGGFATNGSGTMTLTPGAAGSPLNVTGTPCDFSSSHLSTIVWPAGSLLNFTGTSAFVLPSGTTSIPNVAVSAGGGTILEEGAGSLTVTGTFNVTSGTFNLSGHGLTVSGTAAVGSTAATTASLLTGSGGSLTVSGASLSLNTIASGHATLDLTGATSTTLSSFTNTAGGTNALTVDASATLHVTGATVTFSGVTTTWGAGSTLLFDGTGGIGRSLTPNGTAIPNVTVHPTSADTVTLASGTLSVSGTLSMPSGFGTLTAPTGTGITITASGTLSVAGGKITTGSSGAGGTLTVTGALSFSSGTIDASGGTGGTVTLGGTVTVSGGTLTMGSGTLEIKETSGAPAVVDLSGLGANTWSTSAPIGLLKFDGTVSVDFTPATTTYGNISVAHATSAPVIKLAGGPYTVTTGGSSSVSVTGGTLDLNGNTLSVATGVTISSTAATPTATLKLGTGGTLSVGAVTPTALSLTQSGGGTATLDASSATSTLTLPLGWATANNGVFNAGGGVTVSGAATVDFSGISGSSTWSSSMLLTLSGTVAQTLTPKAASGTSPPGIQKLSITNTAASPSVTLAGASATYTIAGTTGVGTGSVFDVSAKSVTFSGLVTITGTGTLQSTGTSGKTYTFGASPTSMTFTGAGFFSVLGTANTVTFTASPSTVSLGTSGSFTVSGGLTSAVRNSLTGAAASPSGVIIDHTSGGTTSVSNTKLTDAEAFPVAPPTTATNCVDLGGNLGWSFLGKVTTWTHLGADDNWSTALNWDSGAPSTGASGDTVLFAAGGPSIIDYSGLTGLGSIDMSGFSGTSTLTIKSGVGTVATTGGVTVFNTFDLNGQTLTVGGALSIAAGGGGTTALLKTNIGGVLSVTGATTVTSTGGTATLDISNTSGTTISTLSASGSGSRVFTAGSSSGGGAPLNAKGTTVDFSGFTSVSWTTGGTGAPLILTGPTVGTRTLKSNGTAIPSLTLAPAGASPDTVLLGANLTVTSSLAVTSGTLDMNFKNLTVSSGTAVIGSTATTAAKLKTGVGTLTVSGGMSLTATGATASATVDLTGCSSTSIGGFSAISFGGAAVTLTPGGSGSPLHCTGSFDLSGLSSTVTWPAGAQLIFDGASTGVTRTFNPTTAATASIPNLLVDAGAPYSDTVKLTGLSLTTLTVSTALSVGGGTFDIDGLTLSVTGVATIGSPTSAPTTAKLSSSVAGGSITVTGTTTLDASFSGTATATLDLSSIPTAIFASLTNAGTTGSRSLTVGASNTLEVKGATINFGGVTTTWGAGSKLLLDGGSVGTRTLTPNGTAIPNVTITTGSDTVDIASGTLSVSTLFSITSGTFDLNGNGLSISSSAATALSIDGTGTTSVLQMTGGGTLSVAGTGATSGGTSITSSGGGSAKLDVSGGTSSTIAGLSGSGGASTTLVVSGKTLHATGTPVTLTGITQTWGAAGTLSLDGSAIGARSFTPTATTIPNLTVNTATDTVTLGSGLTVGLSGANALNILSGTLDGGGSSISVALGATLTIGNGVSVTAAALTATSTGGSFSVASGATSLTTTGLGTASLNVTDFTTPTVASFSGSGTGLTLTVGAAETFHVTGLTVSFSGMTTTWGAGSFLSFDGASSSATRSFTPNATTIPNVTVACGTDTVSLASGTLTVSGTLSATGGTLTANGNLISILSTGSLSIAGGTVQTAGGTISVAGSMSMSSGTLSGAGGAITFAGTISFTGGTLAMGSGTLHLSQTSGTPAAADFSGLGSNTWTSGTLVFDGTVSVDFTPKSGTIFGSLNVASSGNTLKLKGSVAEGGSGTLSVTAGTLDLNANALSVATSATIKPSGAGIVATVKVSGGTFSTGGITASFFTLVNNGGTATLDASAASSAVNLTTDTTGYPSTNDGTFNASGTVTISSSAGSTPVNFTGMSTSSVWASTMVLTLSGSSPQTLTPNGTVSLENLTLTKGAAGTVVTLAGAGPYVIAGTTAGGGTGTTITTGTLQIEQGVTFSGPVSIGSSGTLEATSGLAASKTITFSDTVGISGHFTFTDNPLTLDFTPGKAVTVSSGGTFSITGGGVSNRIQLFSTSAGTQWTLTVSGGTVSVSGARIKDGFVSVLTTANSSSSGGNNTNWVFGAKTTIWTNGTPTDTGDGLWTTATNWSNDVPATGDTVTYAVTTKPSTNNLGALTLKSFDMTGYSSTLTFSSSSLTVQGDATISGSVALSGNSLTVCKNFTVLASSSVTTGTSGTLSVTTVGPGTTTLPATATIDGSNGTVNIFGSFAGTNAGTLTVLNCAFHASCATANFSGVAGFGPTASWGTGTLFLDCGAAAQTFTPPLVATTFAGVSVAVPSSNSLTLAGNVTATSFAVSSGTCDIGGNVVSVSGGTSVTAATGVTTLLKTTGGTLTMTGGATLTQTGTGTATLNGAGATTSITLAGAFSSTNNGSLVMNDGKLHVTGTPVDFSGLAANTWTTGTLFLDGGGAQSFTPGGSTYGNLTVAEGTGNSATLLGSMTLSGALSDTSGALFINGFTLMVGTSLSITSSGAGAFSGVTTSFGGTLVVGTTTTITTSGGSTSALDANFGGGSGTITLTGALSFTGGTLTIGAGSALHVQAPTVDFSGLTTPTFAATSTLVFDGSAATQTFTPTGITYGNVTVVHSSLPATVTLASGSTLSMAGNLTITNGTFNVNGQTLSVTGTTKITAAAGNVSSIANAGGTINFTGDATVTGASATINGSGGGAINVSGNLTLAAGTLSATTILTFTGATSTVFDAGAAVQSFAGIVMSKTNAFNVVSLAGAAGVGRTVTGLVNIVEGDLDVASDYIFAASTNVGSSSTALASLTCGTANVQLTLGSGATDKVNVHNTVNLGGGGTGGLKVILGVGTTIQMKESTAVLSMAGTLSSKLILQSATPGSSAFIAVDPTATTSTIKMTNVSVRDNNANGVVDSLSRLNPINATTSVDRGNNQNWNFQGGGFLAIVGATALGDGTGRINKVHLIYSRKIDTTSVGGLEKQFVLEQVDGSGNVLNAITGTATNIPASPNGDALEIVFGTGIGKTDVAGLQCVYTAPSSGFLLSVDQIPANTNQTASAGGSPNLTDGAPPVLTSMFAQDTDANGGLDKITFYFSEAVAFSPGFGLSISGFTPATDTTKMGGNTLLTLSIAGETAQTFDIATLPQLTGGQIAAAIQTAVQNLMVQPVSVTGHNPLNRAAYLNFTCTFANGRYLLRAGMPVKFDSTLGEYVQNPAASSVTVVVGGAKDASPQLQLGAANGGVERPGSGNALSGSSSSIAIASPNAMGTSGTKANLAINGEDFRDYSVNNATLELVAQDIENGVRATSNEAHQISNQPAYSSFVAIPDRVRSRLVLVSGSFGPGSQVVVNSSATNVFASVAGIGSNFFPTGASEVVGQSNTTPTIAGLSIVGQDGSNLLLGKSISDVTVSGNAITVSLTNVPNSGTSTPSFYWQNDGDLAFVADVASVPNVASGPITNDAGTSNIVLSGDTNHDLAVTKSPGQTTIDVSQSIAYVATTGTTVTYTWSFVSGPQTPTGISSSGPTLSFSAGTGGAYFFQLLVTVTDSLGNVLITPFTDATGNERAVIEVDVSNMAPIANAGPSQFVVGKSAVLDGSGSFDPNGGAITYSWSAVNSNNQPQPSTAFSSTTVVNPTFTPTAFGSYLVTLTVAKVSNPALTASATTRITIADSSASLPTADAGANQVVRVNTLVTLNGSGSRDPLANSLTYLWTVSQSPAAVALSNPSIVDPTFTPTAPGSYVFQLVVSDSLTTSAPAQTTVVVVDDTAQSPRHGPAAEPRVAGLVHGAFFIGTPPDLKTVMPTIVLADGTKRQVTLVDLPTDPTHPTADQTKGMLKVQFFVGGQLAATLYAPAQPGDEDPASVTLAGGTSVTVLAYGIAGQPLVLDATHSRSDQTITHFLWKQVDGPFAFSSQDGDLIMVMPVAGTYTFDVTVVDDTGFGSFTRRVRIPVLPAAVALTAGPPSAFVTVGGGATLVSTPPASTPPEPGLPVVATAVVGGSFTLSANTSVSRPSGTLTYKWTQVAGPIAILNGQGTDTLSVTTKVTGPCEFQVVVTDANGVSDVALVWVTIGTAERQIPVATIASVSDQTSPSTGQLTVKLDGGQSSGVSPLTYVWSQSGGVPQFVSTNASSVSVTLTQPGEYEFDLQVSDGVVTSSPATVRFRVFASGDSALVSGTHVSKTSGGCEIGRAEGSSWGSWIPALLLLGLLVRRRGAWSVAR